MVIHIRLISGENIKVDVNEITDFDIFENKIIICTKNINYDLPKTQELTELMIDLLNEFSEN